MRFIIPIILILASSVYGDSETLDPDSVSTPDQWANVGGANKVESVSDNVDDNYIDETTQGEKQRFTVENAGDIGPGDIIDSIVIHSRMKTPSGPGAEARVNHVVDSIAYGTTRALQGTYTNYSDTYSMNPEGGGWTLSDIDNLKVEADAVTIPILKRAFCTKIYVVVYYTPAAPAYYKRRIYQQSMLTGD
ncbi:MAG: hypothetical protein JSW64_12100 [Candidatus Zixiibacteriota bacterium]|nr:MAG: hypothetical protein JSW64_12100 [candidate division Zixibacteria bacterium]